jgi:hypothetical protein
MAAATTITGNRPGPSGGSNKGASDFSDVPFALHPGNSALLAFLVMKPQNRQGQYIRSMA